MIKPNYLWRARREAVWILIENIYPAHVLWRYQWYFYHQFVHDGYEI